jgi:hemerythrin-like domain-containing protein
VATTRSKSKARKAPARNVNSARRAASRTASRRATVSARGAHSKLADAAAEILETVSAQPVPEDALAMLETEHREVEGWFDEYEELEDDKEKLELAHKIFTALIVHTEIEETIFYPQVREAIDEDDLMDEAVVEHMTAKQLIGDIETARPNAKLYDAKVKVLGEYVKHHVKEEENEMFPKIREESGLDLEDLRDQMMEKKEQLLERYAKKK